MKRRTTRLLHEERIEDTVCYLMEHLDDPMDLGLLADRACLSRFYFHRIFQALLGETVGEMARRLRLERAAHCLRVSRTPITQLAFEAGYATHEAFIRAFRAAFACTPSDMRHRSTYAGGLPTPNGVHFNDCSRLRFIATNQEGIGMQVEIRELPARKAVCMTHRGPYYMIGKTFGELGAWRKEAGVPLQPFIALYHDDACSTPAEELRSDAGMLVPDDFTTTDPRVHLVDVAGGLYAVGTHIGGYDSMHTSWEEVMKWLPGSGYSWGDAPGMEVYVDDCDFVPVEKLRTEVCVPVKKG